jgi:ferredoxin--NADP+ reductase
LAETIGSAAQPLRVAVFGSGPAGFYACEELLRQEERQVTVDLFDRLPTPFGLVRGGVAPDHQKIKSVIRLYERTAARPGFRFFGNVTFGTDLALGELLAHYHQVLFCTGAETDRRMDIPGEDLPGSFPATQFVGWYNGHPDYRHLHFDLSAESAAVVGIGNVAMDVARILARPSSELAGTDIADYALEALRKSRIRTIYLLGRRGPAQAAFTNPEIRELGSIDGCDLVVRPRDLELDPFSREFLAAAKEPTFQRNVDILTAQLEKGEGTQDRKIRLFFLTSPVEVLGGDKVAGLRLVRNQLVKDDRGNVRARATEESEDIKVELVFRSIGYMGVALPELPFDERSGTIPNAQGRVLAEPCGSPLPRLYVAGWIKRGPSGVIGTNKPDAIATVKAMLEDVAALTPPARFTADPAAVTALLEGKGVRYVTFEDWKRLDQLEIEAGAARGKPREKFTSVAAMLEALG